MTAVSPPPAAPRRRWARPALRAAQVVLVAAIVYFLAAYLVRSWSSIKDYDWTLRPGWLALSGIVFLAFYVMQALAWWLLLRGFRLHSPFPVAMSTWGKSILARYVPGNVFMFVSRAWMSHGQGLPVDRVSAAMVYEQALGVCSALVAIAALFPFWQYARGATALSLLAVPLIIVLLHPRVFGPLSTWVLRVLRRPPLEVTLGFGAVLGMLCFYVAAWMVAGLGAWLLARAVTGLRVGELPVVIVAYALSFVIGMAAFIFPSGIGVREAVLTASLRRVLPGGVALAWALLLRLWVTAIELLFVGLAVLAEHLIYRRRDSAMSEGRRLKEGTRRSGGRGAIRACRTSCAFLRSSSWTKPSAHARSAATPCTSWWARRSSPSSTHCSPGSSTAPTWTRASISATWSRPCTTPPTATFSRSPPETCIRARCPASAPTWTLSWRCSPSRGWCGPAR